MKRFWICILIAACLSGCAAAPQTQQTLPPETVPTVPETVEPTVLETVPPTEPQPEPVAEQITGMHKVILSGTNWTGYLSDSNHYTKRSIKPGDLLTVESSEAFSSLYITWDTLPGEYTLSWDGGSMICGGENFFHDYIRLPEAVSLLRFEFNPDITATLCDILIFTEGTAPEGIQDWQEPCDQADVLVFPTHSDDDALFFGALMSYYAIERELTVQTAFMVEHYWYPERNHERLNGLWEMGLRHYPILYNAPDTMTHDMGEALAFYADSNICQWQVEQIRRFKPLVVVGHDLEGEYGNGGHKVNAYYLVQAVELAAHSEYYPESALQYGVWDSPKLYLHLYEENRMTLDVNTPMENDPLGRTPFQVAEDAYKWHVSQHGLSYKVRQDENYPDHDCRFFGLYRSLVGEDSTADIMENIVAADWRK